MKNKLTSSLATLSAVLGIAACAACASNSPQPASPTNAQASPTPGSISSNGATNDSTNAPGGQAGTGVAPNESGMTPTGPGETGTASTMSNQTGTNATGPNETGATSGGVTGGGSAQSGATGSSSQYGAAGSGTQSGGQYGATGSAGQYGAAGSGAQYGATNTMGALPDASGLNDAQIAAVMVSINQGEIDNGQLAEVRAFSPAVRNFAQHMVTSHTAMLSHDQSIFSRGHIVPSDNAVSNELKSGAQNQLSTLQSAHGRDFDRQYIDDQVSGHQEVLKLLDQLIANAKSDDLKANLQASRAKVEDHLRMAKSVQQGLQR